MASGLDVEVRRTVAQYRPSIDADVWEVVGRFVRDSVTAVGPSSSGRASMLLWATTGLACHAHVAGDRLDRSVFDRWNVEEFIATGCPGLSPQSRNTMRSALFRMGEVLLDDARTPLAARIGQGAPLAPYTNAEVVALRSMARWQSTAASRRSLSALISLGLGAGFGGADVRVVRRRHVTRHGNVVWVEADSGPRPRVVPVLTEWAEVLLDAVDGLAADAFAVGAGRRESSVRVDAIGARAASDVHVDSRRLRITWMVRHLAAGTPMNVLAPAAGVRSLEPFSRLLRFVPDLPPGDVVAWLSTMRADQ